MPARPTKAELKKMVHDGTYERHVRSTMKDFCFTINPHEGKDRIWFGSHTVTINRNVAFNFFDRDVSDDPALEPYPVIRGERTEAKELRVRADPDDPATETKVIAFYLAPQDYRSAIESMEAIREEYGDLRTLPDAWFADTPLLRLLETRLLSHPRVKEDRGADWPPLLI